MSPWKLDDPPWPVSDAELAVGADVYALTPDPVQIPARFHHADNPWRRFVITWLATGLHPRTQLIAADPISAEAAFRHLRAIGSAEINRDHKRAAMALLASRWFIAVRYASPDGSNWQVAGDLTKAQTALSEGRRR